MLLCYPYRPLKWPEAICFSSSKTLTDLDYSLISYLPFETHVKEATPFSFTVRRKWTDAPPKWLEAKDINGCSILQLEESKGPHEYHMRSASHFLRCWLRLINNKMGNNCMFSFMGYDKLICVKKCFVCIYHLPGGYFLLKGVKVLIVLYSTCWKLSVSFAIYSFHISDTHSVFPKQSWKFYIGS